jgi:hypothetical protein
MLPPQGPNLGHRSIVDTIEIMVTQQRRIGTETEGWRLLNAILEAQDYLQRSGFNHKMEEDQISRKLAEIRKMQSGLTRHVQSETFISVCENLPELDRRKGILDSMLDEQIDNPDYNVREVWEKADNLARRQRLSYRAVHVVHYEINKLGSDLADLYLDVARQAILEEYFIAPDDENLEQDTSEDDTSVVEDAAQSLSIE